MRMNLRRTLALTLLLSAVASCTTKPKKRPSDDDEPARTKEARGATAAGAVAEPIAFVRATSRPGAKDGAVAISLGDMHGCALGADGRVLCWGNNWLGQTHPRTLDSEIGRARLRPLEVVKHASDLSVGGAHSCAVVPGGVVRCWGSNMDGTMGSVQSGTDNADIRLGSDFARVVVGFGATCGMREGYAPACVGGAENGRLLRPDTPQKGLGGPFFGELAPMVGQDDALQLALGGRHTCALSKAGEVRCWGLGNYGQIGTLASENQPAPRTVSGLEAIVQLEASYFGNCARDTRGSVWCWGRNNAGELGVDPTSTKVSSDKSLVAAPQRIEGLPPSAEIALGSSGACSRGRDGGVTCWGGSDSKADFNEPGTSHWAPSKPSHALVHIPGIEAPVALAVSSGTSRVFACALSADGRVLCWGDNREGQLGDGGQADGSTPIPVVLP